MTKRYEVTLFEGYSVFVNATSPEEAWRLAYAYCPEELREEHQIPEEAP